MMSALTCQLRVDPAQEVWWLSRESGQAGGHLHPDLFSRILVRTQLLPLKGAPCLCKVGIPQSLCPWRPYITGGSGSSASPRKPPSSSREKGGEKKIQAGPGPGQVGEADPALHPRAQTARLPGPWPPQPTPCPTGITCVPRATVFVSNTEQTRHLCEVSQEAVKLTEASCPGVSSEFQAEHKGSKVLPTLSPGSSHCITESPKHHLFNHSVIK